VLCVACITALTVQSTSGVRRTEAVPADLVAETLEELARDITIAAVHIGMLADYKVAAVVARFLEEQSCRCCPGSRAAIYVGARAFWSPKGRYLIRAPAAAGHGSLADIDEGLFDGLSVTTQRKCERRRSIAWSGSSNVVVTGAISTGAIDVLGFTTPAGRLSLRSFQSPRLATTSTHGTGCAFATALACHLRTDGVYRKPVLLTKSLCAAALRTPTL